MKNNKGITLTSLIIYIAVIFVVIAALMRVTTYFSNNMQDAADVSFEAEFNKLNLYLLDETKTIGNIITNISEDKKQIIFTNGNTYLYNQENKAVYLNGTIKICENVESCGFEELVADNGKNVLELRIKINGIEKCANYVIKEENTIGLTTLLPSEYQEVEYIESTGTQYIDTGIGSSNVGQTVRIELDFQVTEYVNNTWICGTKELECGFSGGFFSHFTYSQTGDYLARTTATGSAEKTTTNKVMLFARDYNGTTTEYRPAKVKIYSTSIYLDDELVRNFIPCYRKSDNVVGLYDLVNNEFYTNSGTGEFLKGEDKNTIVQIASDNQGFINEEDYIFDMVEGNEIVEDSLPSEYQQVEYIQSSGTQYIDTGINMASNIELHLNFKITQINASNEEVLLGSWDNNLNGFLFGVRKGNFQYAYGNSAWNGTAILADNEMHNLIVNKDGNALLDEQVLAGVGVKTLNSNTSIYLFNTNVIRTWNPGINARIFEVQIYEESNLIRNFIPCYRKSDNVVGMYDMVNDVFYTNVGTGTFIAGPDVK